MWSWSRVDRLSTDRKKQYSSYTYYVWCSNSVECNQARSFIKVIYTKVWPQTIMESSLFGLLWYADDAEWRSPVNLSISQSIWLHLLSLFKHKLQMKSIQEDLQFTIVPSTTHIGKYTWSNPKTYAMNSMDSCKQWVCCWISLHSVGDWWTRVHHLG